MQPLHALLITSFLLAIDSVTSSTHCSSILEDRCIQKCNGTNCECNARDGQHVFKGCTQMCGQNPCQKITCSSGTCIQSCHGCAMECTSGVGFCVQRCLSGKCSFVCKARRCEQDCSSGDCKLEEKNKSSSKSMIPKPYLLLLAGCFATTAVLSSIALCLSYRAMKLKTRNAYQRLRPVNTPPSSIRGTHATRHGHFVENYTNTIRPETIGITVLPLPDKPI